MIPTNERKRVSRPENKRSRPKITKNKKLYQKNKVGFKIRIVVKNEKKKQENLFWFKNEFQKKGVKIESSEKKSEKRPRIRKKNQDPTVQKISSDQNS